ncbi:TetR/AcrR family transcriptional regulator [Streptomyces boninensis]|uniref:TetR/AcrR family transcriptional regulator n=1 Tax=Streptomyces boninensis TaxID=2039455 RepID=UPI003B2264EC
MATDQPELPTVWARPTRKRREQPSLSREQIVSEAIQLLDADGLEALSMRKLGARLNAGATSMYTHVRNKEEIVELVVDEIFGELDIPSAADAADWRAAAARSTRSVRAAILRHPWSAPVLGAAGTAYLGPNMMRLSDGLLALFEAAGFAGEEADRAMDTLFAYAIGMSISEAAMVTAIARSGMSEQEWAAQLWPAARQAAKGYPRLERRYAEQSARGLGEGTADQFDAGVERILDGLERRL